MKLHQLQRSKGLKDKAKQRGRGDATGTGNYSGRGLKGQKARSGHSMKAFFEGGQTSIIQRLPKAKGFKRPFKLLKDVAVVNLGALDQDKRISDTLEITKAKLKELGYIKHETVTVKILGDGDYGKHLTFTGIELFSKSAQAKMTAPLSVESRKVEGHKVMLQSIKDQKIAKEAMKVAKLKNSSKEASKAAKEVNKPAKVTKVVAKPLLETGEIAKPSKEAGKPIKKVVKKKTSKKDSE